MSAKPAASTMFDPPPLFVAPLPPGSSSLPRLSRLLIANRGEIACRIIQTCRKLNITSIAIYVDEDDTSQHIALADESIGLGSIEQPGGNPFLNIDLLVSIAADAGANAIHPGYGYLSENAQFASAVSDAGITFVGPSPYAMLTLGDKRSAKDFLQKHDQSVPLIPGFSGASQASADLEKAADEIGYPVMLKASAGGGGKGMRIVRERSQLLAELERAQSEAARFFGSSDCILEKYIEAGKHIEIQILGDSHGNVISLGERDCSVQRRHQKVIEETPSPWLDEKKRQEMSNVAVRIGKLLQYENAGTVEFVFDVTTNDFYFLEVNTRLQVEHPITEEVTRLDIVSLQLFVASGGDLMSLEPLKRIERVGHAIECRLCAEDPQRDFCPGHGTVRLWRPADVGPLASRHVRFETAVATGSRISIHFDPMVAKLVIWAPTRELARAGMVKLLADTACVGVVTNQLFLQICLLHEKFSDPGYTTSFIPQNLDALLRSPYVDKSPEIMNGLPLLLAYVLRSAMQHRQCPSGPFANVRRNFRNQSFDPVNDALRQIVVIGSDATRKSAHVCTWTTQQVKGRTTTAGTIAPVPGGGRPQSATEKYNLLSNALRDGKLPGEQKYSIVVKESYAAATSRSSSTTWVQSTLSCLLNGKGVVLRLTTDERKIGYSCVNQTAEGTRVLCHVPLLGTWYDVTSFSTLSYFEFIREKEEVSAEQAKRVILAPMPCKVLSILKKNGDNVKVGEKVVVVESMKMEINIFSSIDGTFSAKIREQDAVDEGTVLCLVEDSK